MTTETQIDQFAEDAPLQQIRTRLGDEIFHEAMAGGPPPTMFPGGNLPAYIASGLDPKILLTFPWHMRHAVAQHSDAAEIVRWSQDPELADKELKSPALADYTFELEQWAKKSGVTR